MSVAFSFRHVSFDFSLKHVLFYLDLLEATTWEYKLTNVSYTQEMQGFLHQAVREIPAIFGSDHVFDGHEPSESGPKFGVFFGTRVASADKYPPGNYCISY